MTRTRRGDSYIDDPRSVLESMLSSSIDASLMLQCRSLFFPDRVQALTQTTQLVGDFLGHILSRTEIGDQGFFRLTHLDETLPLNVPIRCTSISDEAMEHCGELPGIEAHDYAVVLWLGWAGTTSRLCWYSL